MFSKIKKILIFPLLLSSVACGEDFVWFIAFNGGGFGGGGLVVVVGTPRDPRPEEVVLVEGTMPEGMEIMPDGTVQGVPKELGVFEFTLEFTNPDGSVEEESFRVEVD